VSKPEVLAQARTLKDIHAAIAAFWDRAPEQLPQLIPADESNRLWIVTSPQLHEYPTNTMRVTRRGLNYYFEREF
jgi:hypothetical protein